MAAASALLALSLLGSADAAEWPDVSVPPASAASRDGSKDAALVIAIEDYFVAPDIHGAKANGRAWVRWLKDAHGVPVVKVLEDTAATREEIESAAKGVAERVEPGGRLWVVYIGHGAPSQDSDSGMLVGVDAQKTPKSLQARSVQLPELEEWLDGPQAEVVLIQDACFSGDTASGDLAPGMAPLKAVNVNLGAKWTVLSAARNDEYAGPLSDGSRPAFSYLVLGALRGWGDADGDGQITTSEAVDYANDTLFETVVGRTQRPGRTGPDVVLGGSAGESGPQLSAVAATGGSSSGGAVADAGSFDDVDAMVAQLEAAKALEERLGKELDACLLREEEAALERATTDWDKLARLRAVATSSTEAADAAADQVLRFIELYDGMKVTCENAAGSRKKRVSVAELKEAKAFVAAWRDSTGGLTTNQIVAMLDQPDCFNGITLDMTLERAEEVVGPSGGRSELKLGNTRVLYLTTEDGSVSYQFERPKGSKNYTFQYGNVTGDLGEPGPGAPDKGCTSILKVLVQAQTCEEATTLFAPSTQAACSLGDLIARDHGCSFRWMEVSIPLSSNRTLKLQTRVGTVFLHERAAVAAPGSGPAPVPLPPKAVGEPIASTDLKRTQLWLKPR